MHKARLEELEQTIGHRFRQPELLERALTHRSAAPDGTVTEIRADNEQLEYLGDAVLGMLVSEYLVGTFPHWSEGLLSKSRARPVNAASLPTAARRLNLWEHVRLGKGEEKTGGRTKQASISPASSRARFSTVQPVSSSISTPGCSSRYAATRSTANGPGAERV